MPKANVGPKVALTGKDGPMASAGEGGQGPRVGGGGGGPAGWAQHLGFRQLAGWMRRLQADTGQRGRRVLSQLAGHNPLRSGPKSPPAWSPPSSPPPRRMLPIVPKRAERQIRRLAPLLLLLSLLVYLLLGAAAFLFFEHTNHEQMVRKWFFNLIVNRHKFARQIASAIFNGTRNMLVIVDYDSSERIQRDLVNLLSQYEQQLELRMPELNEWTFDNSLTYCWGLLTTIGHGQRAPKTRGGQVFALLYCLLGVPFFLLTLIVLAHRLFQACHSAVHLFAIKRQPPLLANHRLLLLLLLGFIYGLWLLIFALVLFTFAIPESFWRSFYTAVLASLSIQSADYNALGEAQKMITLGCASISLLLACLCLFSLTGVWRHGRGVAQGGAGDAKGRRRVADEKGKVQQVPKFQVRMNGKEIKGHDQVVIDQIGSVKLASSSSMSAPNSPLENNGSSSLGKKQQR